MKADDFLINGKFYVWKEIFAIVKSRNANPNAFANIVDKNETTVIIDESKFDGKDAIEIDTGWKMLTFDMVLPFGLVGFMAKVSTALTDENISIFVISAYSTDHILVKKKDVPRAIRKIESLGCVIERK